MLSDVDTTVRALDAHLDGGVNDVSLETEIAKSIAQLVVGESVGMEETLLDESSDRTQHDAFLLAPGTVIGTLHDADGYGNDEQEKESFRSFRAQRPRSDERVSHGRLYAIFDERRH